jgi:fructose-bisphosphate aldolase class II
MLEAMIRSADVLFPDAIFAVHLDHGDEEAAMDCVNSGFYSSVMIDASMKPYEENIAITARVVKAAHARGISVEAELGQLGGVEEHISVSEDQVHLTEPAQAADFVKKSGCDSLACAIGTSHGAYKFAGSQGLHFEIIEAIQKLLPGFPLVMHGSSSVPKSEVDRINAAGGAMKNAKGVDASQFLKAAKLGVTKVNIDTDGRLVWCRVHREYFKEHPDNFDLRPPGKVFMAEFAKYIVEKSKYLGSEGQLDGVRQFLKK